jgi:hypothetical protein
MRMRITDEARAKMVEKATGWQIGINLLFTTHGEGGAAYTDNDHPHISDTTVVVRVDRDRTAEEAVDLGIEAYYRRMEDREES